MAINVFRQELKMHLRSVITWSVAVAALILAFVSLFSSFAKQADQINQLMANYPKALLDAFGLNGADLSTVLGFFGFVFLFIQICLAIQAANYGFSLVSIEEREWTADFLLSKPVKRTHILTGKLFAALVGLTITNAADTVIEEVEQQIGIGNRRVFYTDSEGEWTELLVEGGRFAGFAPGRI